MGDPISQAEFNALLNESSDAKNADTNNADSINSKVKTALLELYKLAMVPAAKSFSSVLGRKVLIEPTEITKLEWDAIVKSDYKSDFIFKVQYKSGLTGSVLLVIKENDAKKILNILMGETEDSELKTISELHISAINEAMNQVFTALTSELSKAINNKISSGIPKAFPSNSNFEDENYTDFIDSKDVVNIDFTFKVDELINDGEIKLIFPLKLANSQAEQYIGDENKEAGNLGKNLLNNNTQNNTQNGESNMIYDDSAQQSSREKKNQINVQPAQFQTFEESELSSADKKNINLIMDVPLQVTVELGRTNKYIKDVLEFGPGSIIELDKLAGEPVDILVNGKIIAKGEVIVIDECFGVRITEINQPSKRI